MITDVSIVGTAKSSYAAGTYIKFKVNGNSSKDIAGNAVIALRSALNNNIMWSWHIWITPHKLTDVKVCDNRGGTKSTVLAVPIGYVRHSIVRYPRREATCTVTQAGSNRTVDVAFVQKEYDHAPVSVTYYQWGRKDPFPGGTCPEPDGIDENGCYRFSPTEIDSLKYYNGYTSKTEAMSSSIGIAHAIENPTTFYTNQQGKSKTDNLWYYSAKTDGDRGTYFNLWGISSSNNMSSNVKTVFDPSPRGFKVPTLNMLPVLTYSGECRSENYDDFDHDIRNITLLFEEEWNTPYHSVTEYINNFGFEFYCNKFKSEGVKDSSGGTILLPSVGHRQSNDGTLFNMGAYFYFWSATDRVEGTYNSENISYINGGYLMANSGVYPNTTTQKSSLGMSVLPVKE